jgi:hypothetical protein
MRLLAMHLHLLLKLSLICSSLAFSGKSSSHGDSGAAPITLFDRFRAFIPASPDIIQRFDAQLDTTSHKDSIWVAVYRSSNNKPSVIIKDEFFQAMRSATDSINPSQQAADDSLQNSFVKSSNLETPVAVARIRPSQDFENTWVLDAMRCMLLKESTEKACEGGSEHTDAICTAIDALLEYHLTSCTRFEGAIRTKATLVSATLLEERGFREVESLSKDMATHVSSLDDCLDRYAERSVSLDTKSPGARQRALKIVQLLGRFDRQEDLKLAKQQQQSDVPKEDDNYDPWAGMKLFL